MRTQNIFKENYLPHHFLEPEYGVNRISKYLSFLIERLKLELPPCAFKIKLSLVCVFYLVGQCSATRSFVTLHDGCFSPI